MTEWLIFLAFACTGGLLLLHGFGKTKENSEQMLDAYRDMLNKVEAADDEDGDSSNDKRSERSEGKSGDPAPTIEPL